MHENNFSEIGALELLLVTNCNYYVVAILQLEYNLITEVVPRIKRAMWEV